MPSAIFSAPVAVMLALLGGTLPDVMPGARPPGSIDPDLAVSIPATSAGKQLRWVLRGLNGEDAGDVGSHFTDSFLERVTAEDVTKELSEIRTELYKNKKVRAVQVAEGDRDDTLTAVISAKGTQRYLSVFIIVDDKSGKIAGLRFEPAGGDGGGETPQRGGSWDEVDAAMDDMQGDISFGCYEIVPRDKANPAGELVLMDIAAKNENRALAIGSSFKLYVLGALAEDVVAGRAKWDEELVIEERLKSLPSGTMQLKPSGSKASIETFALNMISISDNTAADHLLARVGRDRVQAYTNAMNDNVARNVPFLSTREMFVLKLSKDQTLPDRYLEADDAAQRAMLEAGGDVYTQEPDLEAASEWGEPRFIDGVEWFASAKQLATAMMRLRQLEQQPGNEPLSRVMRKNPGLALDTDLWKSVAFKGGSEPGVINMTWLLERDDGRWYVFSVGQNDKAQNIDQSEFNRLCYKGLGVLADDGRKKAEPTTPVPVPVPPAKDPFMDTGDEPTEPVDDGT